MLIGPAQVQKGLLRQLFLEVPRGLVVTAVCSPDAALLVHPSLVLRSRSCSCSRSRCCFVLFQICMWSCMMAINKVAWL